MGKMRPFIKSIFGLSIIETLFITIILCMQVIVGVLLYTRINEITDIWNTLNNASLILNKIVIILDKIEPLIQKAVNNTNI